MRLATDEDQNSILSFLHAGGGSSLYLYINANNYGVSNAQMPVWLDDVDPVRAVASKYFNSIRIHCAEDFDSFSEIAAIVNAQPHTLVFCSRLVVDRLLPLLSGSYRDETTAYLRLHTRYRRFDFSPVLPASEADVPEIAQLLCDDPVYTGQCEKVELEAQILHRMRSHTGINFIIRDENGRIAVHDSIMAQTDGMMIGSQFICRSDARKHFLAETMENYVIKYATEAGCELYAPIVDERRFKQFLACGASYAGECVKLIREDTD